MNCKLCGKELGIFGKVQFEGGFICKECHKSLTTGSSRWGRGIPRYKSENQLRDKDFARMAMDAVRVQELGPQGIEVLDDSTFFEEFPYFTCMKDGHKEYVILNYGTYPNGITPLSFIDRKNILDEAEKADAGCSYVNVLIKPVDTDRAERGLYLKNDEYEVTVQKLKRYRSKVSPDWIESTLAEIDLLDPERKKKGKAEQSSLGPSFKFSKEKRPDIKCALSDASLQSEYTRFSSMGISETFQETLMKMISARGLKNPEFYNAAMIDRKLFSTIKNNRFYKPKKETAVACCFGLKLNLKEAESLLGLAGFRLSKAILWDRIIYFCLDHGITDLDIVNELLYAENQKCIGVLE